RYTLYLSLHDALPIWQSLTDIKVTHKPRYYIDLTNKNSIFDSQESYEKLRNASENEKNIYVQEILRTRSNKPQWYLTEPDVIYPDRKSTRLNSSHVSI